MAEQKKSGCGCLTLILVILIAVGVIVAGSDMDDPSSPTYSPIATYNPIATYTPNTEPTTYVPTTTAPQPEEDRLPGLDDSYEGHLFLDMKGYGDCNKLTGKILLTFLMVDDTESTWNGEDWADFERTVHTATAKLQMDARGYGVPLTIVTQFLPTTATGTVSMMDSDAWAQSAVSSAGYDINTGCADAANQFGADQCAFFLCINRPGRSFAKPSYAQPGFECAVLYREHGDYRHELNHLFGAEDFYFPEDVKALAAQYLPNSVMVDSQNSVTDELTAYLVGWTETPGPNARAFLDATAGITREMMDAAYKEQTFTGYATKRWGEGTYTGDWVEGIPYGRGSINWDNGDRYEGDWVNGTGHGQGTYHWSNGDSYSGQVDSWKVQGYGTYRWSDGTVYVGDWVNGTMHGTGTCTWKSGASQSGRWENGNFIG